MTQLLCLYTFSCHYTTEECQMMSYSSFFAVSRTQSSADVFHWCSSIIHLDEALWHKCHVTWVDSLFLALFPFRSSVTVPLMLFILRCNEFLFIELFSFAESVASVLNHSVLCLSCNEGCYHNNYNVQSSIFILSYIFVLLCKDFVSWPRSHSMIVLCYRIKFLIFIEWSLEFCSNWCPI